MSRPRPSAVVFDMDGLMFNTEELYQLVCREMLRRRDKPFEADLLNQMMGRPARNAFQVMIDWHQLTESIPELAAESAEIFAVILETQLAPMPGLFDLLAALEKAGIPKAVATSSGRKFTTQVLGRFELEPRFQFLLCSEDVTEGKPHPEIYQTASARLSREPAHVLVLEDSHHGCKAAIAAGAFAVAVPGGHSHTHDFTGAQFVAQTLADPRIYEALGVARG
jgi:HAD superfamily hydrolase (TIGR01509 family)